MNLPNFKENINAYAAWNTDVRQRVTSASGGIAYAIYESAIQQNMLVLVLHSILTLRLPIK